MRYIVQLTGTQVKYGDDSDIFQFQLWEGPSNVRTVDDAIVDLTGSIVTVDIANDSGFVGRFVTTTIPEKGIVNIDMSNEVITALPADTYYFQVEVDNGTKKKIFPTDGGDIIKIFKSLTETQGELVPRTTIDDVLNRVDEKISEYTKTVAKGDKGDKGDMDLSQITIGGRNLVSGTSDKVVQATNWNMQVADIKYDESLGRNLYASVLINNADHADTLIQGSSYIVLENIDTSGNILKSITGNIIKYNANGISQCSISMDDNTASVRVRIRTNNMMANTYYSRLKVERGNVPTDWTPAPEDINPNLAIGGRNLLLDTRRSFTANGNNSVNGNLDAYGGRYYLAGNKKVSDLYNQYGSSGYLTLSFDWVASGNTISGSFTPRWDISPWEGGFVAVKLSGTNTSGHYKYTIQLNANGYSTSAATLVRFRQDNLQGTITVSNLKLEASNVVTDWTPAPEDVPSNDAQLVHKTGNETVAGDKTFTSPIIGTLKTYEIKDGYDMNGYKIDGIFFTNGAKNLVNYPANASTWATLVVHVISDSTATQTLIDTNNDIYVRTLGGNPATWGSWTKQTSEADTKAFQDKLIAWETPKVYDIPMTGVFANSTVKGNLLVKGNTLSFNFGGSTGTLDAIPDADNVIGQLPDEVAKPLYTIRGFAINVSQSGAPDVAIRINPGGNITFNPDSSYTPKNANEYWELSATGFTREVLNPLANTTYANALVLGAGIGGQGATFTKDYYMGMGGIDDIKLYVYDRNKKSQIVVDGGFGHNNDGFVGHANNLAVLKDESSTGGKIWLAASHMYNNGLAIISYTPSTGKGQTEGHITVTATDGTKETSMLITSTQAMDANGTLIISAAGKLFKGTVDLTKLNTEQTASFNPISKNAPTANDYQNMVGSTLASLLTTGQSHWVDLENNLFYSIRTMNSLGFTISLVMEMKLLGASDNPVLTGNYWMTNEPSWSNNEIEAIWFENNKLMASYTKSTSSLGANMMVAELTKL